MLLRPLERTRQSASLGNGAQKILPYTRRTQIKTSNLSRLDMEEGIYMGMRATVMGGVGPSLIVHALSLAKYTSVHAPKTVSKKLTLTNNLNEMGSDDYQATGSMPPNCVDLDAHCKKVASQWEPLHVP